MSDDRNHNHLGAWLQSAGYSNSCHGYGELVSEKRATNEIKAFCSNRKCAARRGRETFFVRLLGDATYVPVAGRRGAECKACGYALFFTRSYRAHVELEIDRQIASGGALWAPDDFQSIAPRQKTIDPVRKPKRKRKAK